LHLSHLRSTTLQWQIMGRMHRMSSTTSIDMGHSQIIIRSARPVKSWNDTLTEDWHNIVMDDFEDIAEDWLLWRTCVAECAWNDGLMSTESSSPYRRGAELADAQNAHFRR